MCRLNKQKKASIVTQQRMIHLIDLFILKNSQLSVNFKEKSFSFFTALDISIFQMNKKLKFINEGSKHFLPLLLTCKRQKTDK